MFGRRSTSIYSSASNISTSNQSILNKEIMQWSSKPDFCLKGKAVSLLNSWLNILFDFE